VTQDGILVAGGDSIEVDPYDGTIYVGAISYGTNPAQVFTVDPVSGAQGILTPTATSGPELISLVEGIRVYRAIVQTTATTTTVVSSVNSSVCGQTVTFMATVSSQDEGAGTPTGTVQFQIDGSNAGGPVSLGISGGVSTASFSTPLLAVGTHLVTASYSGNASFAGSSGSLSGGQAVNKADTTTVVSSSVNPSVAGQTVTFTATMAVNAPGSTALASPTGSVIFSDDGTRDAEYCGRSDDCHLQHQ
jgi:large repetitive protein